MPLTLEQQEKILTPAVRRLLDVLDADARAVGGAVRDTFLRRAVFDIDIASPLPPERVMEVLAIAKIKTVPTGFAHGTVTAVLDGTGYEITTLRRDVETYGRHAKVQFTDDWQEDASRRDFTMNAMSVDAQGALYDYFGGEADAKAGRVRFIGDPRQRIREDVLRILRYFRFYAFFGRSNPDADALGACRDLASLIPTLSAERISKEFLKLLSADTPVPSLRLMMETGVLIAFMPEITSLDRLEALLKTEKANAVALCAEREPVLRLASLLPPIEADARAVASKLKLSNRDTEALATLAKLPEFLEDTDVPQTLHRLLYAYGAGNCRAATLLKGGNVAPALDEISRWKIPVFPAKGEDIVKLGVPAGPQVGQVLRALEKWWIDNDFQPNRQACMEQAKQIIYNGERSTGK
ncbi:MAG: CCA tRNA nucleotidyltransferase [Alphaproteobacteria bacterium]|nr:CCA tRNA nucleotidyltransferase [Alphaproteobacteria bacterium]